MAFVLQDVIKETEESRSLEPLKKLKEENLVKVTAHFGITPAVSATKSHILDLIEDYCVENNIINEVEEKATAETVEVLKLKLEFQCEERRLERGEHQLEHEEAQRACEAAEAEAQKACDAEKALQDAELAEAKKA